MLPGGCVAIPPSIAVLSGAACLGLEAHVPGGWGAGKSGQEARAGLVECSVAWATGEPSSSVFVWRSLRAVFWKSLLLLWWSSPWGQTSCWCLPGPFLQVSV